MPGLNKDIKPHPIHAELKVDKFDVCVVGSGPIGATFARLLVDAGHSVVMIEVGDQETRVPAARKKNEIGYQKDIDRFVKVIQGALSNVSVPTSTTVVPTLDPASWTAKTPDKMTIMNERNPRQAAYNNLPAEAVTRGVGGMSTHWTCATPRFLPGLERPVIFSKSTTDDDNEWDRLYSAAEILIGTSTAEFTESIRNNLVLETLKSSGASPLPLACHRIAKGSPYVQWHSAENVFGDMFDNPTKVNGQKVTRGKFALLRNTLCVCFASEVTTASSTILAAEVLDLLADRSIGNLESNGTSTRYYVKAEIYVTAAGAVCTPQILAKSGFGGMRSQIDPKEPTPPPPPIPNLAIKITEQPMAFCQIVLSRVDYIKAPTRDADKWWKPAVDKHIKDFGKVDELPIPFKDPDPQVTIPVSLARPWHAQIHRDAFSYGDVGPRVDSRLVVDLRFFGMQDGVEGNRIIFEDEISDAYGMPQPTFEYLPTDKYANKAHEMMNEMTNVASKLGGYLPGSDPQFMAPGLALHLGGTVRLGLDVKDSVANFNSQVWKFTNLYVGGNGVIPTPFAANPTLTSMALAIRAASHIHNTLEGIKNVNKIPAAIPDEKATAMLAATPDNWLEWTKPADPNFPNHGKLMEINKNF